MSAACETAAFLADDPACLVEASLACPACLSSTTTGTRSRLHGYDPSVECVCENCGHTRRVFLTPQQALRLSFHVAQPPDLAPRVPGSGLAI